MIKNILFIIIVASIALASCNKNNVNGKHANRYEMLISKRWYIGSMEENNMPYTVKDCQKDNYYVFTYEDEGRWEEGDNNCFVGTSGGGNTDTTVIPNKTSGDQLPTYTAFKWEMPGDQREVHIWDFGFKGANREWKIESMDETHLDVRTVEQYNGKLYVYNVHLIGR